MRMRENPEKTQGAVIGLQIYGRGTDPGTLLHIKRVNMEEFRHLRIKDTEKRSTLQTENWKDDEWPPEHIIHYHRPATQAEDVSYG
ncbi:Endogenous Retrovirus Group 3 Member 1 Env Polyprotein [Manis pentadactyla]|nr:Endogenous Retrovirus Group 3 Member 1 Env Polyprotein [Manis pentadactyla]